MIFSLLQTSVTHFSQNWLGSSFGFLCEVRVQQMQKTTEPNFWKNQPFFLKWPKKVQKISLNFVKNLKLKALWIHNFWRKPHIRENSGSRDIGGPPPQARTTFFAKIRIADMTENVGKRRKLSENVGNCRKTSEIVGNCRKMLEIVGRCRKMLVSSQHCVEECNIYLTIAQGSL